MKLNTLSRLVPAAVLVALLGNGLCLLQIKSGYDKVAMEQNHRQKAVDLSTGIRQELDLLARLVRDYTSTADPRFLIYYYDILAIRAGEKAAPAVSAGRYWDQVIAGTVKHALPEHGSRQSLESRMEELGFSPDEFAALSRVLTYTEELKATEAAAFAAMQGLYDPSKKEFINEGKPNREFAIQIIHSPDYSQKRSELAQAVDDMIMLTNIRTARRIDAARATLLRWIRISYAAMAATTMVVFLAFMLIRGKVLDPINALVKDAQRLAENDYTVRASTTNGVQELTALAQTFNAMAASIQDDLKRQKAVQRELEHISITDPLTKCYNRRYMENMLPQEIANAKRYQSDLTVIMCDIDHFKKVNDTYGHDVGDQVLTAFGQIVREALRATDWAARYGGEEFIIVLPDTPADKGCAMAERLRAKIEATEINADGKLLKITSSLGVAGLSDDITLPRELIGIADGLLYRAKHEGRNCVKYHSYK